MEQKEVLDLATRIEAASYVDPGLNADVVKALRAGFPEAAAAGHVPNGIASSTDSIVELVVAALAGWHFSIHGRARPDIGPWTCSLRRSDVLDDDEMLGAGEACSLNQAVLAAVLRVMALR